MLMSYNLIRFDFWLAGISAGILGNFESLIET